MATGDLNWTREVGDGWWYAGAMKKRDWTDAEFEIVKPAPTRPQNEPWNGVGLPPEWGEATWYGKVLYVVCYVGLMSLVMWGLHALVKTFIVF